MVKPDLSVIILNYNTKKLLQKCLESVFSSSGNFEVIVSDNGSKDGSVEMVKENFPQVKLIENGKNLGFAAGNNVALRQASGRYYLLLNSDTEVAPDAFEESMKYLDSHSEVGCLGVKLLLPDGSLDQATRRNFPNPWNSFLRLFGLRKFSDYNVQGPVDEIAEIDATVGAYMMVPKVVIDKVGLLDEEFFMYGEDLDWCYRIKQAGYKVVYFPRAVVRHYKYGSSQLIPFRTIRWAHTAMKIFYRKHYAEKNNWFLNQLVYLGINLRMFLVLVINIFRPKKTVH